MATQSIKRVEFTVTAIRLSAVRGLSFKGEEITTSNKAYALAFARFYGELDNVAIEWVESVIH